MAGKNSLKKRILSARAVHYFCSLLFSLLLRLLYFTCRARHQFPESAAPYLRGEKPAIFCFWHGRMIMHAFIMPKRPMYILISHHNDGELITMAMKWFGVCSVRIARKRNGTPAIRELLEVAARGDNISITPDGPRGPFQQAAEGAAYVAIKTGYPLIPVTFSAARHWRFRSWDQFMLPKFFTRILFITDAPVHLTNTGENEASVIAETTAMLQERMVQITAQADRALGVKPA